jgi:hypothetical protein
MSDIIKDKAEYDELTEDEKKALVAEFDEFKSRAAKRPPNITARTKSTECAKSFQAVRDEVCFYFPSSTYLFNILLA